MSTLFNGGCGDRPARSCEAITRVFPGGRVDSLHLRDLFRGKKPLGLTTRLLESISKLITILSCFSTSVTIVPELLWSSP